MKKITFTLIMILGGMCVAMGQCDPVVQGNPSDSTICNNTAATINLAAASGGNAGNTYLWQESMDSLFWSLAPVPNSNQNYNTQTLSSNKYYRRRVVSGCDQTDTIYSLAALITINTNTTITIATHPSTTVPTALCHNTNSFPQLDILATGAGTLSYQWYGDTIASTTGGMQMPWATNTSYIPVSSWSPRDYYYYCEVTGACSSIKSNISGVHTIKPSTAIKNQPSTVAPTALCYNTGNFPQLIVTAIGEGLTYKWFRNTINSSSNGTEITGATSANYIPPSNLSAGNYYYYCTVTGNCGSATSNTSGVHTIKPSTAITNHPYSVAPTALCYNTGNFPQLSVNATGIGTLTYKWYRNTTNSSSGGTEITGATSATYTPPSNLPAGNYYYYCIVTGECGSATSNTSGMHTIKPTTAINNHPSTVAPTALCYNTSNFPQLSVTVIGAGSLTYKWYRNTTPSTTGSTEITGATSATYTPPSTLSAGNYYYYCTVSGDCGSATSNVSGMHTIKPSTAITNHPSTVAPTALCYNTGNFPQLNVTAIGAGSLTYKWFRNITNSTTGGTEISGATSATYIPPSNLPAGSYYYYCIVTSDCGSKTSDTSGEHIIKSSITIMVQPSTSPPSALCYNSDNFPQLSVTATGVGTLTYQWYINTTASTTDGTEIQGATSATYTPTSHLPAGSYYYYCVITGVGECGSASSNISGEHKIYPAFNSGTIHAEGQIICLNDSAMIIESTNASGGDGKISYQWKRNGSVVSGANGSAYTPPTNTAGTFVYTREAKDGLCSAAWIPSDGSWTLTVYPAFNAGAIYSEGQTICLYDDAITIGSKTNASGGDENISYQWKNGDVIISGATESTYTPPTHLAGNFVYTREAKGGCDDWMLSVGSWLLTVENAPDVNDIVAKKDENGNPYILIYPNPKELFGYQWYRNGTMIENANEQFYYIHDTVKEKEGMYTVYVSFSQSKSCGNLTKPYELKLLPKQAPLFTLSPNPAPNGFTTVSFNRNLLHDGQNYILCIYSLMGEKMWEQKVNNLDDLRMSKDMPAGFYMVTLNTGEKQHTEKLLINKQ